MSYTEMPETFVARHSENFEIVIPRKQIEDAIRKLAETTNVPDFRDAMELAWFKFDPNIDTAMRDMMSMLLTLDRCAMDGNVKPPLNLEKLYNRMYQEMKYDNHPVGPTP
ncbi:MAG: hypothetical protein ACYDHW_07685 [Syntrophorhabdaceae bacterium]